MTEKQHRSDIIHYEGMTHAPENELGVVFLFGKVHKLLGFTGIDEIKPGFPDCWAWRRGTNGARRTWIEFEFRSSGFNIHVKRGQTKGIRPKKGFVVCWEHNWPECEKHAQVIDLRAIVERGPRVWIQSVRPKYQDEMDAIPYSVNGGWTWDRSAYERRKAISSSYGERAQSTPRDNPASPRIACTRSRTYSRSCPPLERSGTVLSGAHGCAGSRIFAIRSDGARFPRTRCCGRRLLFLAQMQGQWDVTGYWCAYTPFYFV